MKTAMQELIDWSYENDKSYCPIEAYDMSDDEYSKSEKPKNYDVFSVDGSAVFVDPEIFNPDASAMFADSIDAFEPISREEEQIFNSPRDQKKEVNVVKKQRESTAWVQTDSVIKEENNNQTPAINVSLRLELTDELRKAKKRMESAFMDDYIGKIKKFKSDHRDDYKGEYVFTVRVGVIDDEVEVKETVTICRIINIEDETKTSDESYEPGLEVDTVSDLDEKRRQHNLESLCFDPDKQQTKYQGTPLPSRYQQLR